MLLPIPANDLAEAAEAGAKDGSADWLAASLARVHEGAGAAEVGALLSRAARTLGSAIVDLTRLKHAALAAHGVPSPPGGWSAGALGRAALVAAAVDRAGDAASSLVRDLFDRGDNTERAVILRTLPLLHRAERFVPLAVDACRTNVVEVFEAIACENGYPARYFSDESFSQMAIKAVFSGVSAARIEGLERRRNPELSRMARDLASERRAAGRAVPSDLDVLAGAPV